MDTKTERPVQEKSTLDIFFLLKKEEFKEFVKDYISMIVFVLSSIVFTIISFSVVKSITFDTGACCVIVGIFLGGVTILLFWFFRWMIRDVIISNRTTAKLIKFKISSYKSLRCSVCHSDVIPLIKPKYHTAQMVCPKCGDCFVPELKPI